ncbi:MAG: hypothetical protein A2Y62_05800 [Candidatus Fischerbacteria bacterium RBG_13_37_8]|uniref:Uncharacterized protein n=1 Tax=Candidatus Fischerbacteria bacterium RBG_13_37_8 TaxID=1817863 RepID=A0A1F5VDA7_9BACT|nr:MAG: hypothetical protein A2Y62_05800 [Candidatus Fischerbacteria bacterium RBG_13_37_8]
MKNMSVVKKEAKELIDRLPDKITRDDIIYELYVKKKLEVALKATKEGKVESHEEIKKRFIYNCACREI